MERLQRWDCTRHHQGVQLWWRVGISSYNASALVTQCFLSELTKLITQFFVLPSSSCTAERSFSTSRWWQSYLRITMTAERLNSVILSTIVVQTSSITKRQKRVSPERGNLAICINTVYVVNFLSATRLQSLFKSINNNMTWSWCRVPVRVEKCIPFHFQALTRFLGTQRQWWTVFEIHVSKILFEIHLSILYLYF